MQDRNGLIGTLDILSQIALKHGDKAQAYVYLAEHVQLLRAGGERSRLANALSKLSELADEQGNQAQAHSYLAESLETWRGHERSEEFLPNWLIDYGNGALSLGAYDLARSYFEESLQRSQERADEEGIEKALKGLAELNKSASIEEAS